MSSQPKAGPTDLFDYVVKVKGPININGAMVRKDDPVRMTRAAAKSYGAQVKRAALPKTDAPKAETAKAKA